LATSDFIGSPRGGHERGPTTLGIVAAFLAVYLIWGSTYLAIRFAAETIRPFLMASVRFLIAGAVLYAYARWRGAERPTRRHWRSTAIIGGLMLLGGNGGVVWSEETLPSGEPRVASGMAALMVATVPLWMVLIEWLRPGGRRPTAGVVVGLAVGFAGMILLVRPGNVGRVDPAGAAVLTSACFWWSLGSIYSRHAELPKSPLLATAMEMLAGGALLGLLGTACGDWGRTNLSAITLKSAASLVYLIVFGSLIAFSAYVWLLRVTTPARVGTYAYVNPIVAVFLGWLLAGEPLTAQTLVAAAVILAGVVIITSGPSRRSDHRPSGVSAAESALAEAEH
jgi:drug/metabolite transporter (DMT)-like permease